MTCPLSRPPETVEVDGQSYPINTDFRVGVEFELALLSGDTDVMRLMQLWYSCIPSDINAAVDAALQFYRLGQPPPDETAGEASGLRRQERAYDFEQDADVLLSSFWQAYGIDLATIQLHWWTFRRLMFGLPEDSGFMRRVHYRTADLSELPKSQKKHYERMRKLYELRRGSAEDRLTLAERDSRMKEYVARRFEETCNNGHGQG
ncbi:Gp15 family bacteriophage protein [Anaeromassilibacillus senegalensis]|uniref:Gp15 family bacteriophage protein n=1 Tax=Anaeromassilibacillus senegalensis TaxID=1673717 RepID=UPI0006828F20|nr:Gp15 family bacteriophage protein [Anaeromassilibacillus senegalensis]